MRKILQTVALLAIAIGFNACVSVPMASLEMDTNAKKFIPKENVSNVYFYRNETFGAAVGMPVSVDGKLAGKTGSKTYFNWKLKPGKHVFKSLTENTSDLTLDTEANKNYFIWQEVKMGMFSARSQLHEVTQEEGEKGVLESELLKSEF